MNNKDVKIYFCCYCTIKKGCKKCKKKIIKAFGGE